jgi:hypothetical protein
MPSNVCLICKCPMRLISTVGDKNRRPVTRVLECVRCHATIYRPPVRAGQHLSHVSSDSA